MLLPSFRTSLRGEISSMEIRGCRLRLLVGTRSDGYIFFPLVGVLPPTNSNYQLYTRAQYYLNAALGVGVEILCPFLWEKIETENPLKRPEHYCIYMLLVEWLTKVMMRYVFNTVCCCFKSLLLHRVFGC